LHESLTPAIVAAPLQLTPDHLNRLIKKSTGVSLMNYVARLRMESAGLLLRTSELSVQEIANLVGYRHVSHFSRAFLKHTGHSPLKFRQHESKRN
jgi:two-component system response regulator YesN